MSADQGTQTPTADTIYLNGCEIFCEVGGSGEPLVFVHGGFPNLLTALRCEEAIDWDWSWERDFAKRYRFISYDRRGCYRSSSPTDGYDLENQATDLQQLMDILGIDAAHVVGSSAGGPISAVFAASQPSRIRSLVLLGTGLQLFPPDDRASMTIRSYMRDVEQGGSESLLTCRPEDAIVSFDALWEAEEAEARGELDAYLKRQSQRIEHALSFPTEERQMYYDIELQAIKAYMIVDLLSYTKVVMCPTLVVHGDNDREVPLAWGVELASQIPNARLEVIKGGSHSLAHRSPQVRQMIMEFIGAVDAGQRVK